MVTRSGVKVGVNVRGQGQGEGSRSGGLGSDGRRGRLEINSLFLSRTHDRIEFHSIPFQSIPFHFNPFHSMFYPMPSQWDHLGDFFSQFEEKILNQKNIFFFKLSFSHHTHTSYMLTIYYHCILFSFKFMAIVCVIANLFLY